MKIIFHSIIIVLIMFVSISGKSLWVDRNIYSSGENLQNGDIIVISINDITNMTFSMNLKNKINNSIASEPDVNITGFLPKINGTKNISNNDKLDLSGKGKIVFAISTVVTGVQANGNLTVTGSKQYVFNGVATTFAVAGIVKPALLKGRMIDSNQVLNFRLNIQSTRQGVGININRQPLAEGEAATSTLTEPEKQRIILDYIQKMIDELSR